MGQKAVFLDRDGVLINDVHLLVSKEQVKFCSDVHAAIRMLLSKGYLLLVVTNQTVIARGLATEHQVNEINAYINSQLMIDGLLPLSKFYVCPHHPNADVDAYRQDCLCRKPAPGLIYQAAEEFDLDLSACTMIGDRISDIIAGHRAGCRTILLESPQTKAAPIESQYMDNTVKPDERCRNIMEAVRVICSDSGVSA